MKRDSNQLAIELAAARRHLAAEQKRLNEATDWVAALAARDAVDAAQLHVATLTGLLERARLDEADEAGEIPAVEQLKATTAAELAAWELMTRERGFDCSTWLLTPEVDQVLRPLRRDVEPQPDEPSAPWLYHEAVEALERLEEAEADLLDFLAERGEPEGLGVYSRQEWLRLMKLKLDAEHRLARLAEIEFGQLSFTAGEVNPTGWARELRRKGF